MDWEHESEIPLEKLHKHSLSLDDIRVARTLRRVLRDSLVVSLNIVDEDEVVVNLVVLGGNQEAGGQHDGHSSWCQLASSLSSLCSLVKEVSVHELNSDVGGFCPLSEFLAHLEKSLDQGRPLVAVDFRDLVLLLREVGGLDVVVNFIPCFVLEHLSQKLGWGNVRIEFFTLVLNGTALIL